MKQFIFFSISFVCNSILYFLRTKDYKISLLEWLNSAFLVLRRRFKIARRSLAPHPSQANSMFPTDKHTHHKQRAQHRQRIWIGIVPHSPSESAHANSLWGPNSTDDCPWSSFLIWAFRLLVQFLGWVGLEHSENRLNVGSHWAPLNRTQSHTTPCKHQSKTHPKRYTSTKQSFLSNSAS